jgi:hypothetical protein
MNKLALVFSTWLFLLASKNVWAVCPVCTIAVAGGLGISRWLGIDDAVTGIWIGGVIMSSGLWLADWLTSKNWQFKYLKSVSVLSFYLLVIIPLYWGNMIGLAGNSLWGVDKIMLGSSMGLGIFLLGTLIDKWLRSTHDGVVYIYYQKVIIPVFLLSLASYVLYIITNQ